MNKTRRIIVVAVCAIAVISSACNVGFSTARIVEAKLSREVTADKEPVSPTTVFDATDPVIHCVARLANAPAGTKVKARWIAVRAEGVTVNEGLAESEVEAGDSRNIVDFTLTSGQTGFPPGEYRVDLFLNSKAAKDEKPATSVSFKIEASGPQIAQAFLSTDSTGGAAVETFDSDAEVLYCHVTLKGAAAGTRVTARWVAVDAEGISPDFEINRTPFQTGAGQNALFFSLKPYGRLAAGTYKVDLFLGESDTPMRTVDFTVVDSGR